MNFSLYDILSQLIPGFIVYISFLKVCHIEWDKDYAIPATVISLIIGYFVNTISSWLEGFYYFTWGGKPSTQLLKGKMIKKIKFYNSKEVVNHLKSQTENLAPNEDELFNIALRYVAGTKDNRIDTFSNNYVFSRVILTTCVIVWLTFLADFKSNYFFLYGGVLVIIMAWRRCKEMAYYYAREVLQTYMRLKQPI